MNNVASTDRSIVHIPNALKNPLILGSWIIWLNSIKNFTILNLWKIKDLSSDILNCNINENVEERQDQISIQRNSAESTYSIERGTRNTEKENKKIAEGKRMISSHMQSSNEMTKVMLPSYSLPVHPRKLQKHKDTIQEVIGVILQKLHVMSLDSTSLSTHLSKKVQDFQNFIKTFAAMGCRMPILFSSSSNVW